MPNGREEFFHKLSACAKAAVLAARFHIRVGSVASAARRWDNSGCPSLTAIF
jgi:hypothetical protein